MDATRVRDGRRVVLKKVLPVEGPHELQISQMFSSAEVATNPHNHCVPLLEVIRLSENFGSQQLMVFPLLRPFNRPRIQTFGEFAGFFTQICEARLNTLFSCVIAILIPHQGMQFMHQRNVAHRYDWRPYPWRLKPNYFESDCTAANIIFSRSKPYLRGFLPDMNDRNRTFMGAVSAYMSTRPAPRYYFIDFGLSRRYPSRDVMDEPYPGGDESAPEHRPGRRLCNPFHTDVYYIGNLVREEFMEVRDRVACYHK